MGTHILSFKCDNNSIFIEIFTSDNSDIVLLNTAKIYRLLFSSNIYTILIRKEIVSGIFYFQKLNVKIFLKIDTVNGFLYPQFAMSNIYKADIVIGFLSVITQHTGDHFLIKFF